MTYKEAQESYHRIQEKKSNLSKSDSAWLKEVEAYPIDERFDTETSKMALLFEIFNNNLYRNSEQKLQEILNNTAGIFFQNESNDNDRRFYEMDCLLDDM